MIDRSQEFVDESTLIERIEYSLRSLEKWDGKTTNATLGIRDDDDARAECAKVDARLEQLKPSTLIGRTWVRHQRERLDKQAFRFGLL